MRLRNPSLTGLMMRRIVSTISMLLLLQLTVCIAPTLVVAQSSRMRIASPAISEGAGIPIQFTCSGTNQSPPLTWTGVPAGTKSLALIMADPDAPGGTFVHWVVYDIPGGASGFQAGKHEGKEGANSMGKSSYMGPCPPPGSPHHYHFKLYALDIEPELGAPTDAGTLRHGIVGHTIQSAELIGIFGR